MASRGRWALQELQQILSFFSGLYTMAAFCAACLLAPCIFALYLVVGGCRLAWLRLLEQRFPELEFVRSVTVRTAVDTVRNQGIIPLLLQVRGTCDLDLLKARLQEDILERSKDGRLVFPHLRTALTSRWGRYAWQRHTAREFQIDNHVVLANVLFRGRPVSELNIQEYVSDIISKFFTTEVPPWQITIIPCTQDRFFLLIRLHHLYLSEEKLGLGDLLLLKQEEPEWPIDIPEDSPDSTQHLLTGTFRTPVAIPEVYQHVCETFSNSWNELVSIYDPLENPAVLKKQPTLKSYLILVAITLVSVIREYYRKDIKLSSIIYYETNRRNLTIGLFWKGLRNTFHPKMVCLSIISWTWWFMIKVLLHLPVTLLHTIRDTPIYLYWLILTHHVLRELWYLLKIVYTGPRVLFEELFFPDNPKNVHQLQTVSLCGRKVVCWSDPVPLDTIKKIREATGAATCEIILSATSAAIRDYFRHVGLLVPESVLTTSRFMPQEYLLKQSSSTLFPGCGLLCLELPTRTPHGDPVACLNALQWALYRARSRQTALYLASTYQLDYGLLPKVLPSLFARVFLNLLSRRYAVTLTQVDPSSISSEKRTRRLLWGQEVEYLMYWRPPQANISMSISLMSYGHSVRLGIMADAQLSPHYNAIATDFVSQVNQLAIAAGVAPSRKPTPPRVIDIQTIDDTSSQVA